MRLRSNWLVVLILLSVSVAQASAPPGFVKTTIPLDAPPVGLAYDANGVLYALEGAPFGSNEATLRVFNPNGTSGGSYPVLGGDSSNFFVGGMTYDPIGDRLLVTDNTADGELYAVSKTGARQTLATNIAGIADVAVRTSGEIFVSSSPFGSSGAVFQVDRTNGNSASVLGGLGFGAGLVFDANNNLIVQDSDTTTFAGRLQRLPTTLANGTLTFGMPATILSGMQSSAGVTIAGGDIYTTGVGGLYQVAGTPPTETSFDSKGTATQFATAIAFDAGSKPFKAFAGAQGGHLAYMADFGFSSQDSFITLLTPAEPGDYNGDGFVNAADYSVWLSDFGTNNAAADGNGDGTVNAADYVVWQNHVSTAGAGSALPRLGEVPEPNAFLVAGNMLLMVAALRRARKNSPVPEK